MARATNQQSKQDKQQKKQQQGTGTSAAAKNRNAGATGASSGAIEMLKQDHRKVEGLFEQFESADEEQKERLVEQICSELIIHTKLEEEIFYPACREAGVESEKLDESQVEHDGAKMLINDLLEADSDTPYFEAKVSVLKEMIKHHVEEEEEPSEGVFAQAQEHDIDDADLAQEITERKQELQQRGIGRRPARPIALGMVGASRGGMAGGRMGGYDERFRGGNERGYGASRRYEEDEYEGGYGRGGRRGAGSEGDWNEGRYGGSPEQGRRYEEDDRRFRSPYEDRDEDRRYGRGQGGWYGDPRGHSEASRRGWEERRHEDDDRHHYRSGRDDDDRHRGHGGWSGDPRGHAEAARRGWQHRR
ncbi:MAG TPA: hemerythrin domain-containing protein [Reyranella sp.]|nr:hemerythrin domain-containing protein [Reyranella sp.]